MGLFLRVVVENLNVWILQGQRLSFHPNEIFIDRKGLALQVQIRNFQRQQLSHSEANEQICKDCDTLGFLHDFFNENPHFIRTQNTHLFLNDFRPCGTERWVARQLVLPDGVCKEVL